MTRAAIVQAQNLFQQSEALSNAYWSLGTAIGATDNSIANPYNGATTAARLLATATTNNHFVRRSMAVTPGRYTVSVFAKKDTYRYIGLRAPGSGVATTGVFDFDTATWSDPQSGGGSNVATALGGGWYRLESGILNALSSTSNAGISMCNVSGVESWTSAGTEAFYAFGLQLVRANWAGPYIATTSAAVNTGPLRNAVASRVAASGRVAVVGRVAA